MADKSSDYVHSEPKHYGSEDSELEHSDPASLANLSRAARSMESTFALGGMKAVKPKPAGSPQSTDEKRNSTEHISVRPIVVRWDGVSETCKIEFPLPADDDNIALEKLVKACKPASFGHKGEDIYDETYRKAAKMDEECFSTNFNPAECGITDSVAQALLPTITSGQSGLRGVHAELYKLNVYSGPSGHFKGHVDTPRATNQIGSLVLCLPSKHTGGDLVVRHRGQTVQFAWAEHSNESVIQWAAFYSDCEHEVLENPASLPLYEHAKRLLLDPEFLKQGGFIGFYCTHDYAHATQSAVKYLPWCLKGVDMMLYEIFKALQCHVILRPVYENKDPDDYDIDGYDDYPEQKERLERVLYSSLVGNDLAPMQYIRQHEESQGFIEAVEHLKCMYVKGIRWLNEPQHREHAMAFITYGNEAGLDHAYSSAALFIKIAPIDERLHQYGGNNTAQSNTQLRDKKGNSPVEKDERGVGKPGSCFFDSPF